MGFILHRCRTAASHMLCFEGRGSLQYSVPSMSEKQSPSHAVANERHVTNEHSPTSGCRVYSSNLNPMQRSRCDFAEHSYEHVLVEASLPCSSEFKAIVGSSVMCTQTTL